MGFFSDLSGTSKSSFKIGIRKWLFDASGASTLRTLTLGNRNLDLSGANDGDVLKILSSTSIGFGSNDRGGFIRWNEVANSPVASFDDYGNQVYSYAAAQTQALKTSIKIPSTYVAGRPIKINLQFYSNDTSGNVLLQSVATLIRNGVDLISSTTNQRTSTNSAVSLSGGTQNIPQLVTLDISSTTGQINGVNIAANDLILVSLSRGTDSATSDASFLPSTSEVTCQ